jgi:ferrous iron transport protein A
MPASDGASILRPRPSMDRDLGAAPCGFRGRILGIRPIASAGLTAEEMERRLLELGFVEGAAVEILHQGLFGRDPIAVRVEATTIALRRSEAAAILVGPRD